jgi:hypothetical protein
MANVLQKLLAIMPGWLWALIIVGLLNEIVNRAKWTRAESIFQGIGTFLLWFPGMGPVLAKTPWAGDILRRMAGIPEDAGKLPIPPTTAWLPILFLLALSACGGLSPYYASLSGVESVVSVSSAHFVEFDKARRAQIVHDAKTEAEGLATLAAWDKTAAKLASAIEGTDASVRLARDALNDISKGVRGKQELSAWIGPILNTARNLEALLASVGFVLPKAVP